MGVFAAVACSLSWSSHAAGPVIDMLPGIVKPARSVELSPSVDGVLEVLRVEEGVSVAEDTVLAVVDRRLATASLGQAEFEAQRTAAVRLATTRVDVAEKYFARIERAYRKEAASELELDEARGRVEEARASLDEANEQLASAGKQLDAARAQYAAHEVRTPIAGQVVRILARRGEMVHRTSPVAMVVDLATLRADLYVPTNMLPVLRVGERYTLWAEAPINRDIEATLIHREPLIDAATETFRCRFVIANQDLDLPAGFAVRLRQPTQPATEPKTLARVR